MMNCLPVFSIAAIMLSAAERSAANGFSSKTCTLYGATLSTQSAWLAVEGQRITISGWVVSRHSLKSANTRSAGIPKLAIAEAIPVPVHVADAGYLDVRVLMALPQEIAHVGMIKVYAGNFPAHIDVSYATVPYLQGPWSYALKSNDRSHRLRPTGGPNSDLAAIITVGRGSRACSPCTDRSGNSTSQ